MPHVECAEAYPATFRDAPTPGPKDNPSSWKFRATLAQTELNRSGHYFTRLREGRRSSLFTEIRSRPFTHALEVTSTIVLFCITS